MATADRTIALVPAVGNSLLPLGPMAATGVPAVEVVDVEATVGVLVEVDTFPTTVDVDAPVVVGRVVDVGAPVVVGWTADVVEVVDDEEVVVVACGTTRI